MKLKKDHLYVLLIAVLVIVGVIGVNSYQQYAVQQQAQYSKTELHVTSLSIVPIPSDYFELSNSSGCFVENGTEPYEFLNITIRNRYNQPINFVNASLTIIPDDIVFMDGYSSLDYYMPQYFYQAGPVEAVTWSFPVRVPMFGGAMGIASLNTLRVSLCLMLQSIFR